jgi:hypothetical protein
MRNEKWNQLPLLLSNGYRASQDFWALAPNFWTKVLRISVMFQCRQLKLTAIETRNK